MSRRVVSFSIRLERLLNRLKSLQKLELLDADLKRKVSITIWVATRNPFVPYRFWERWDFFIGADDVHVKIKALARKAYM